MDCNNSCLICLNNDTLENKYPEKMKLLVLNSKYLKPCDCNVYMHFECLNEWIINHWSCPICRHPIYLIVNHPIHNHICFLYSPYIMIIDIIYKFAILYIIFNFFNLILTF